MLFILTGKDTEIKGLTQLVLEGNQVNGVPQEIQIVPYGYVKSKEGNFIADEKAYKDIISNFDREKNDIVIDYEHQTLTGRKAPAAGWIKELMDRGKEGLWARVEWVPKAGEHLAKKEYKYLSPVIWVRKSDGRAAIMHSAALTNTPAIDGMTPIVNKSSKVLESNIEKGLDNTQQHVNKMLGLSDEMFLNSYTSPPKEPAANMEIQQEVNEMLGISESYPQNNKEINMVHSVNSISLDDKVSELLGLKEEE